MWNLPWAGIESESPVSIGFLTTGPPEKSHHFILNFMLSHVTGISRSVQLLSHIRLCNPMGCSKPGLPLHHQLPEFTQTHVHWVGDAINHLLLCRPLLLPSIFLSIRIFSNESVLCIRWPKYWSFSFSISPSNKYSGPISFRIDWLDLLAVQKTLKSLLQHYSSKASILQGSAFFIVQLSDLMLTNLIWGGSCSFYFFYFVLNLIYLLNLNFYLRRLNFLQLNSL